MSGNTHPKTQHPIPEDLNLHNLKSQTTPQVVYKLCMDFQMPWSLQKNRLDNLT
jgi:hypothetical protein